METQVNRNTGRLFLTGLILLCLLSGQTMAQVTELLKNGDMEAPGKANQETPNNCGQISRKKDADRLTDWRSKIKERKKKTVKLHSPEWFRNTSYTNSSGTPQNNLYVSDGLIQNGVQIIPAGGHGYIGLGECELVQQKLEVEDLETGVDYKITMDIRLRTTGYSITDGVSGFSDCSQGPFVQTAKLKVWLSKGKFAYSIKANKIINSCTTDYCNKTVKTNNTDKITGLSEVLSTTKYPSNSWHTISAVFTAPNFAQKYNWLIIEITEADNFCNSYVLIDNVSLAKACDIGCTNGCSPTDGPIGNVIVQPQITKNNSFTFTVPDNIHTAQLTIQKISDGFALYKSPIYYCSNGISQPISWNGLQINSGQYRYVIDMENDCFTNCPKTGQMQKTTEFEGTIAPFNCYTGPIIVPDKCCPLEPDIYLDNIIFPSTQNFTDGFTFDYKALNNIYVATSGNVIVQNGSEVSLQAGNEVVKGTFSFSAELGAEYSDFISPCIQCKYSFFDFEEEDSTYYLQQSVELIQTTSWTDNLTELDELQELTIRNTISVYPNPFNGMSLTMKFEGSNSEMVHLSIIDMTGAERFGKNIKLKEGEYTIHLNSSNSLSPGAYILKATSQDKQYFKKLVIH